MVVRLVSVGARGLSPKSTTCSDAPRRWRTRRPLASRVQYDRVFLKTSPALYCSERFITLDPLGWLRLASYSDALRLVTRSTPRKSAQRTDHILRWRLANHSFSSYPWKAGLWPTLTQLFNTRNLCSKMFNIQLMYELHQQLQANILFHRSTGNW